MAGLVPATYALPIIVVAGLVPAIHVLSDVRNPLRKIAIVLNHIAVMPRAIDLNYWEHFRQSLVCLAVWGRQPRVSLFVKSASVGTADL